MKFSIPLKMGEPVRDSKGQLWATYYVPWYGKIFLWVYRAWRKLVELWTSF